MDTAMILRTGKKAWCISISCLIVPFSVIIGLSILLHSYLSKLQKEFLFAVATSVSITAFPVLAYALDELNLLTSDLGQLAMSSAMLNDMLGWFFMVVAVLRRQKNTSGSIATFLSLTALIVFIIYVLRPAILWVIKKTPIGNPIKEYYIIAILLMALVTSFISDIIGATTIYGPLVLGMAIPDGPPLGATLVKRTELVVTELLLPLLFVGIGFHTDVFSIDDWKTFAVFQSIVAAGYVAKLVGTLLPSIFFKIRVRKAFLLSLVMNIRGLIEVITFANWSRLKLVDAQSYTTLVLSTLAVTATVTPLIEIFSKHPSITSGSKKECAGTIQTTPHTAELRILSCIHDEENVHGIITLLEASNPTKENSTCVYVIHLIELLGRAAPLLVPHNKDRMISNTTSSDHIMRAFENYTQNSAGRVSMKSYTMVAPYKSMHEGICRLAQDQSIPLIIVPFHKNQAVHGELTNSLRYLNLNLQSYAPCTVGILIDRGLHCHKKSTPFSCHVAVLFFGGADDREALAYGARMSVHPGMSIKLWRFLSSDVKNENEMERQLDESLIGEFKLRNTNNARALFHEVEVENGAQAIKVIRSLENNYDLVMVGRQRGTNTLLDDKMMNWCEYPELGVVGDIVASSDFCGGMVSVLVMQHCRKVDGWSQ